MFCIVAQVSLTIPVVLPIPHELCLFQYWRKTDSKSPTSARIDAIDWLGEVIYILRSDPNIRCFDFCNLSPRIFPYSHCCPTKTSYCELQIAYTSNSALSGLRLTALHFLQHLALLTYPVIPEHLQNGRIFRVCVLQRSFAELCPA